jgi:hypothetical protein
MLTLAGDFFRAGVGPCPRSGCHRLSGASHLLTGASGPLRRF